MRKLLLLIFTLALMVGCGGGGDDNGFGNTVAENFARRFVSALNQNDVDDVAPLISFDYYEDCWDRNRFLDEYELDVDSDPNFYQLDVVDVWDQESLGDNLVRFMIRIRDRETDQEAEFPVYIRCENGVWKLYGNQDCNDLTTSQPTDSKKVDSIVQYMQAK